MKTHIRMEIVVVAAALTMTALCVHGALTPEATLKEWPTNAAMHVISVARDATNGVAGQMIAAAEAAPGASNAWWLGAYNTIKLPYALTKDAVDYYQQVITAYQTKTFKTYCEPNSSMKYEAHVAHHATYTLGGTAYTNVHVVSLKLSFSANFTEDSTTGAQFGKERTVVLDANGKVLAISGDGKTEAMVLAI